MSQDRLLCGWRVASELPLPDLLPWRGEDRAVDIEVRLGATSAPLGDLAHDGPLLKIAADGTCRFEIADVAAYLVKDGRCIIVEPKLSLDEPDIRLFLLGSVFGVLCHQRGLLPLHAGCVEIDGRAVAFAGPSGAGKSTLTAAFWRRGHPVLADDVTVVDVMAEGGPRVLPSFPRFKLWRDAMDGLGFSADGLERVRDGIDKVNMPLAKSFRTESLPLSGVYLLETVTDPRFAGVSRLRGAEMMAALTSVVYRRTFAALPDRRATLMAGLLRLASLPVTRLSRMMDFAALDATVTQIAALGHQSDGGALL